MASFIPWTLLGSILHAAAFVLVSYHVLSERREPSSALLWIFIAWALPFLGPLAYLCFGVNRISSKGWQKHEYDELLLSARRRREEAGEALSAWQGLRTESVVAPAEGFERDIHRALDILLPDHPVLTGNTVDFLLTGDEAIPAILASVRSARHHIHLQSFIIGGDAVGRELMELLAQKAREGVQVRLLHDRFGSTFALLRGLFKEYRSIENLHIAGWTQANVLKRQFQINLRNHRKILVVDGTEAYCGGVNLSTVNRSCNGRPPIRDYHFRLRGPVVHELQYTFMRDWHFITDSSPDELLQPEFFPRIQPRGERRCRLINSGPGGEYGVARDIVFQAFTMAEKQILAVTPYFVPPMDILKALRAAAQRGVDVRLVVPARNNHWFAGMASRAYYQELLEAGVRIFQRPPPFMHAKAIILDGRFTLIGTANLDVRSLVLNYETNLAVYDEAFADQMKAVALDEIAVSREILLQSWRARPHHRQLAENLLSLLTPIL